MNGVPGGTRLPGRVPLPEPTGDRDPHRCLDCGTAIARSSRRCRTCNAAALHLAIRDRRPTPTDPADALRRLLASVAGPGVTVWAFADDNGALVASRAGGLFVLAAGESMTDAAADLFFEVDRAGLPRLSLVRDANVDELAAAIRGTGPNGTR